MSYRTGVCFVIALGLWASTAGAGVVVSVTDSGSDSAITNGPTSQRENDKGATVVPFAEDAFTFTDRNHQYNGARFTALGVLTSVDPAVTGDITIGLPSYLLGYEYVSTRNNNRDNANFQLNVKVGGNARAYLLLDNRIGDPIATNPATLGNGVMDWVLNEGWTMKNTGISPNGQPDFGAIDEGGSISDFNARPNANSNLGVGAGVKINNFWTVWQKDFAAGSTIELKQQNAGGINMYGMVVAPEPASLSLLGLGALALLRRVRK